MPLVSLPTFGQVFCGMRDFGSIMMPLVVPSFVSMSRGISVDTKGN